MSIKNSIFLKNERKFKKQVNLRDMCLVTREFMKKILDYFEVDKIIKIPYYSGERNLKLSEAVILSIQDFRSFKPVENKFEMRNNIESIYMYLNEDAQFNMILSLSDNKIDQEDEKVSTNKDSKRRVLDSDSVADSDKNTKDKTLSDKSSIAKSLTIRLDSQEYILLM
jgi:hypothetical protein